MDAPLPFDVRRSNRGIEIRPHADAWRTKVDPLAGYFVFIGLALYVLTGMHTLIPVYVFGGISVLAIVSRLAHRRHCQVPLRIAIDRSSSYCGKSIDRGGRPCAVRIVARRHRRGLPTYGVEIVRRGETPIRLPSGYFDDLPVGNAVILSVIVAKALDAPILRGPVPAKAFEPFGVKKPGVKRSARAGASTR
jgi:hypothetical protein